MNENLFDNPHLLPQMMLKVYQEANPQYPVDVRRDYPALRSIGEFLSNQAKLGGLENAVTMIIDLWRKVCHYIVTDRFYQQKSLSTISNHIQELVIKTAHGDNTAKSKSLSRDSIAEELNNRFKKG